MEIVQTGHHKTNIYSSLFHKKIFYGTGKRYAFFDYFCKSNIAE